MRCYAHLYFYYNEKEDKIKISHCFLDRDFSVIGEIDRNEFYSLSENQFYEYLKSIVFTKPILCDGINCNEIWKSLDYKIGRIDVAISRQCNLSCPMCYAQDGGHKDSPIRKKLYLDVIDKLKNFEFDELRLTDWGEPLIYINDVLERTKSYKFCKKLSIVTNGTFCTKEILNKLVSNFEKVTIEVDVDSLKKSTFEKIRKGANFEKYFENLYNLIDTSKKSGNLNLILHCTVQELNKNEVNDIRDFAKQLNIFQFFSKEWKNYSKIFSF